MPQNLSLAQRYTGAVLHRDKASSWGKKLAKQTAKASINVFDRFKATMAKMKKARAVRKVVNQLKNASQKK
jgi:large subunit ribosomal protein L14e